MFFTVLGLMLSADIPFYLFMLYIFFVKKYDNFVFVGIVLFSQHVAKKLKY